MSDKNKLQVNKERDKLKHQPQETKQIDRSVWWASCQGRQVTLSSLLESQTIKFSNEPMQTEPFTVIKHTVDAVPTSRRPTYL